MFSPFYFSPFLLCAEVKGIIMTDGGIIFPLLPWLTVRYFVFGKNNDKYYFFSFPTRVNSVSGKKKTRNMRLGNCCIMMQGKKGK